MRVVAGPFPGFVHVVGAEADAAVFFAGSLFFTAAAALQFQLAGTLFFNRWGAYHPGGPPAHHIATGPHGRGGCGHPYRGGLTCR